MMLKSLKRMVTLLLSLLFLQSGAEALAKIETVIEQNGDAPYFAQITTFEGELPRELNQPLSEKGFGEYTCYSGAMLEYMPKEVEGSGLEYTMALVAMEKDGERTLLGLRCDVQKPWSIEILGAKMLLPGRDFSIVVSDFGSIGIESLEQRFSVRYPRADGGMASYGFWCNNWYSPPLWYVESYEETDARGRGTFVANESIGVGQAFDVGNLPVEEYSARDRYFGYLSVYAAHMSDISEFPTTAETARRMAEDSWKRFEGTDLALCYGVNLREKATMSSKSLGVFNPGTLIHVLGQAKGIYEPWYHVRVGLLEGWMSGMYVGFPLTEDNREMLQFIPLPVARATDERTLLASPKSYGTAVAQLPEGTLMHVLATVGYDWLYVMVPSGELGWEMDVDGTSGFVQADWVVQGSGAAAVAP